MTLCGDTLEISDECGVFRLLPPLRDVTRARPVGRGRGLGVGGCVRAVDFPIEEGSVRSSLGDSGTRRLKGLGGKLGVPSSLATLPNSSVPCVSMSK